MNERGTKEYIWQEKAESEKNVCQISRIGKSDRRIVSCTIASPQLTVAVQSCIYIMVLMNRTDLGLFVREHA